MNPATKYFLVAFLSLSAGVAFAYPLYYGGYVEPLSKGPHAPTPDVKIQVAYANFSLQPNDNNQTIPSWYNMQWGQPDLMTYNIVMNVTNYSNQTALVDKFSLIACNSTASFTSIFQSTNSTSTVEGLWLDGKWINVTWVPEKSRVPAHWRQGVDIGRTFVMGKLSSVSMEINGSWMNVTDRVKLLEKDTIDPMAACPVFTEIIARGELRFFNPNEQHPDEEMAGYSVKNVNLVDGFNNNWLPGQSRLILINGTIPIIPNSTSKVLGYLNSNQTLVYMQATTHFSRNNIFQYTSSTIDNSRSYIMLQTNDNTWIYNGKLSADQIFQQDHYGIEVFITSRS